jgi:hypothetical protein
MKEIADQHYSKISEEEEILEIRRLLKLDRIPEGTALCDGRIISKQLHSGLFAAMENFGKESSGIHPLYGEFYKRRVKIK